MAEQLRAKDVKRVKPGRLSRLFKCQNQCCDTQDLGRKNELWRVGSVHACLIHAHTQRGQSEGAP